MPNFCKEFIAHILLKIIRKWALCPIKTIGWHYVCIIFEVLFYTLFGPNSVGFCTVTFFLGQAYMDLGPCEGGLSGLRVYRSFWIYGNSDDEKYKKKRRNKLKKFAKNKN